MSKLIVPTDAQWALLKQKATSAAPGLDPTKRFLRDKADYTKHIQDASFNEAIQRDRDLNIVDNGRSIANHEARMGKMLSSAEIEKRLKVLNPNVHIEPSIGNPAVLGIYILGNWGTNPSGEVVHKKFVCRMDAGWLTEGDVAKLKYVRRLVKAYPPEYEMVPELDETEGGFRRGWRSILASLLKAGFVTEAGIFKAFGPPTWDSARWQQATT